MAKKAKKKTTTKAVRKTAKKKASGKKTSSKKAPRSSRSSSAFPTMEADDRQSDLYSPPAGTYNAGPAAPMGMDGGEEGSSRRVAILGILVLLVVIVVAVVGRDHWAKKPDASMVDSGKKESKMEPAGKATSGSKMEAKKEPAAKAAVGTRTYTVKKGDNLGTIARKMLGNSKRYREIMKLNGLKSDRDAKLGQVLKIPAK